MLSTSPPTPGTADHTDGGYAGDRDDDTGYGYGYAGAGYDPDGYPETGYRPGYDDTGTVYPVTGDVLPVAPGSFDDTGMGYADPVYGDGRFPADAGGYPDDGGYPATDDGQYLEYGELTGGDHRDRDGDHGYGDREGWYGDEQPGWAQDDDSGFLPGMSTDGPGGDDGRAGARAPGRGRRPASAGRNGSGRARSGPAATGQARGGNAGGGKRKSGIRRLAPWLALSVVLALLIGPAAATSTCTAPTFTHPTSPARAPARWWCGSTPGTPRPWSASGCSGRAWSPAPARSPTRPRSVARARRWSPGTTGCTCT